MVKGLFRLVGGQAAPQFQVLSVGDLERLAQLGDRAEMTTRFAIWNEVTGLPTTA